MATTTTIKPGVMEMAPAQVNALLTQLGAKLYLKAPGRQVFTTNDQTIVLTPAGSKVRVQITGGCAC